jgi:hypothetical protein
LLQLLVFPGFGTPERHTRAKLVAATSGPFAVLGDALYALGEMFF